MSRTVLFIDGHSGGHHRSFLKLFSKSALEQGDEVFLTGPAASSVSRELQEDGDKVGVIEISELFTLLFKGLRIIRLSRGAIFLISSALFARWQLRKVSRRRLVVFLPYIYAEEYSRLVGLTFRLLGFRWGGLWSESRWCRHPEQFPNEDLEAYDEKKSIYEAFIRNLRIGRIAAIGVLDEACVDFFHSGEPASKGLTVQAYRLPEIIDERRKCPELTEKIKAWAGPRRVVTILGALKSGKGLVEFCELAQTRPEGYCFVIGGEINWTSYTGPEISLIQKVLLTNPDVINFAIGRLESAYFDGILDAADLIFLRYRNWTNSSNMLSHAVRHETPVLVEDGFVLAERVKRWKLGQVVSPGMPVSLPAESQAMAEMCSGADWAGYARDHERPLFHSVFSAMLDHIADA